MFMFFCCFILFLNWTVFNEVGKLQKRESELDFKNIHSWSLGNKFRTTHIY